MKKFLNLASAKFWAATTLATILNWVLFLCANTNSCCLVYQPSAPKALDKYKKF